MLLTYLCSIERDFQYYTKTRAVSGKIAKSRKEKHLVQQRKWFSPIPRFHLCDYEYCVRKCDV